MNILCTICSDLVIQTENIYVTKCGHIFHQKCLGQWIERSKTCPQCRNRVTEKCMSRIYPTVSNDNVTEDVTTIQTKLDDLRLKFRQLDAICSERDIKLEQYKVDLKRNEKLLKSSETKLVTKELALSALQEQVLYLKLQNNEVNKLKNDNEELNKTLQTLNGLQKVLNSTSEEVENMLKGYSDIKTMAVFATALKKALCESLQKKNELSVKIQRLKQQNVTEKNTQDELRAKISHLEERLSQYDRRLRALRKRNASDISDQSKDETISKHKKQDQSVILDTTGTLASNSTLNSLVENIENADSPYLTLKQSSVALSAMNRAHAIPADRIKPSEFALINAARSHTLKRSLDIPQSIFHKKAPLRPDLHKPSTSKDISYDGLGGHSKLDTFPKPKEIPTKSLAPKLTAKHKLKRPAPAGNQSISNLMKSLSQKSPKLK